MSDIGCLGRAVQSSHGKDLLLPLLSKERCGRRCADGVVVCHLQSLGSRNPEAIAKISPKLTGARSREASKAVWPY